MEPQETVYCYDNIENKYNRKRNCLGIIAIILLAFFTFVLGLIIGAVLFGVILDTLPAIIVLAIVLGLLLLLTIILMFCNRKKEKKCKCCY